MVEQLLTKEAALIAVPIVTLILGLVIGWLGQRSGFCSIGGIRDYMLFRQTRLLKGYAGLIIAAFVSYLIFSLIVPSAFGHFPWALTSDPMTAVPGAPAGISAIAVLILMIIGGIAVGIIGTLLGGCPLRQVVMTSEGNVKSLWFVVGMCLGALVFSGVILGLIVGGMTALGI
jgi:uncharacterized membrane protein YedE/YeeE